MHDHSFNMPFESPEDYEQSDPFFLLNSEDDFVDSPLFEVDDEAEVGEAIVLTIERVLKVLETGTMEERGLLPYSSNYSFLVLVDDGEISVPAVYKPRRGENPLWDFPTGTLCQRETAAFDLSHALGWNLVPPTVLREGTRGIGSVQFYIHCDPEIHYFTMREDARYAPMLRRMVLFDFIINNADRKSGHCLFGYDERVWAIDHGICFHQEYKLRSVIWEFSGQRIEDNLMADLLKLQELLTKSQSDLSQRLLQLINSRERAALCARLDRLIQGKCYPAPLPHQRNHPWPPV